MRSKWVVAAGVLVLVAAACSSGSSKSGAKPSTTKKPASTTTVGTNTTAAAAAGASWTTYYGDASRPGRSTDGPTTAAAKKQWASPTLDGDLYAQPILAGDRMIMGTENDTVYSLNAADGTIAWQTHLGTPVAGKSLPCGNVDPVGITSTPVVDVSAGRVYAVGMVQPAQTVLFDLDLATGKLIASTVVDVPGSNPLTQNQRSALTLAGGKVFVPFGGRFGDCGSYHGRVVSVPVTSAGLGAAASYTLPTQNEGGFWAPPGASVAKDGSLYLTAGNSSSGGAFDQGDSVVRISADLQLLDSFTPSNWKALNASDLDLGTTGPVLLPGNRVFQVGKEGVGYLLDAQKLGGIGGELHAANVCGTSHAFGAVARDGETVYVPCLDRLVQVTVSGDGFSVGWSATLDTPGPPIVAGGAVWTVTTGSGDLVALDPATGKTVAAQHVGEVPSRFTSLAAGGGRVVVGAGRVLLAFGS
jgi:outer membrane protein assembly factor BamB